MQRFKRFIIFIWDDIGIFVIRAFYCVVFACVYGCSIIFLEGLGFSSRQVMGILMLIVLASMVLFFIAKYLYRKWKLSESEIESKQPTQEAK